MTSADRTETPSSRPRGRRKRHDAEQRQLDLVTIVVSNRVAYLIKLAEQHERRRQAIPDVQGGLKLKPHGDIYKTVSVLDEDDNVIAIDSEKHPKGHIRELHDKTPLDSPFHTSVVHTTPRIGTPTYTYTSPRSTNIMPILETLQAI